MNAPVTYTVNELTKPDVSCTARPAMPTPTARSAVNL